MSETMRWFLAFYGSMLLNPILVVIALFWRARTKDERKNVEECREAYLRVWERLKGAALGGGGEGDQ